MDWYVAVLWCVIGVAGSFTVWTIRQHRARHIELAETALRRLCTVRTVKYRTDGGRTWAQTWHSRCEGRRDLDRMLDDDALVVTETAHDI